MKIIHTADLHLDAKMDSHLPQELSKDRKHELLLTFERMVEYAKNNEVRAIIIAGDLFDRNIVARKTLEFIGSVIKQAKEIDFLYLAGNHDKSTKFNKNAEQENVFNFPENFKVLSTINDKFIYDNVVISGDNVNSSNDIFYNSINFNESNFNILVLHGETSKYKNSTKTESINLTALRHKNINYLALGHYHSFASGELDSRGTYCYSGCLEGRGFDETDSKGFVVLDVVGNKADLQFVPFAKRQYKIYEVDISGIDDFYDVITLVLSKIKNESRDNIVRIVLVGNYNNVENKDIRMLEIKLNDIFYFAEVCDKSHINLSLEDVKTDISLKGEFLKKVLQSSLSVDDKKQIIELGLKALKGEDVL
ncbi:MAG: DNA repair exonuclease [Clostridia bacterium]